jgi:crossover junction endodeoxyribonuclease RuvC
MNKLNTNIQIILGIDPGIEKVGIAIIEITPNNKKKETVVYSECFMTDKKIEIHKRLALIYKRMQEIIKKYSPTIVAIEHIFFSVNQKTAIVVAEARGVILASAGINNLEIIELTPNEIKQSVTGYGKATKKDIIKMIPKIIDLPTKSLQDDEIDAIAIALSASSRLRYQQV